MADAFVTSSVVLALSPEEALALFDVLGRVSGTGARRELIDEIYGSLVEISLDNLEDRISDDDVVGEVRFLTPEECACNACSGSDIAELLGDD